MATDSITLQKICQNKSVKAIWREFSIQNLLPSLFPRFDCWRDVRNVIVECPQSDTQLCFINVAKASGVVGQRKSALLSSLFIRNFQNKSAKKFPEIFSEIFAEFFGFDVSWLFAKIGSNDSWHLTKTRPISHKIREIQRFWKRKSEFINF